MYVFNLKSVGNTSFDTAIQGGDPPKSFVYDLASEPSPAPKAFDKDFGLN